MICMFDELLAFVAGMITASVRIKNPSPKIYAWAFVIGMAVIGVGFFLSLAISKGLLPALHLMGEKIFSPIRTHHISRREDNAQIAPIPSIPPKNRQPSPIWRRHIQLMI